MRALQSIEGACPEKPRDAPSHHGSGMHKCSEIKPDSRNQTPENAWLISPRADFWFASAGASLGVLAAVLVLFCHGDRELDAVDLILSELHLGATYSTVIQRKLWRRLPLEVVYVPAAILIVTYALSLSGQTVLLTSIAMYAAVWHRARQSWGIARFYQRKLGGTASGQHEWLFRGAIYLPMIAAALAYTHLAPAYYEGEPYIALSAGADVVHTAAVAAVLCVIAYLVYAIRQNRKGNPTPARPLPHRIHPGELWIVMGHAAAFGSSYALGASNAAFLLVLAVHHEVQYLYFAYAVSRTAQTRKNQTGVERATTTGDAAPLSIDSPRLRSQWRHATAFSLWPVLGLAGAMMGGWLDLSWLAPLGTGGLFCHYWLDSRIWTRRALSA
jgi:hypothetical protein